jgi:hypothetical protein
MGLVVTQTPRRRSTVDAYVEAISPIAAILETLKPSVLTSNETLHGNNPFSSPKDLKEVIKHGNARRKNRKDNFALQDVFEKFIDDPASFSVPDTTSTEVSQPAIEAPQAVIGTSQPTIESPKSAIEPPEPTLESPQSVVEDHQPVIEGLQNNIQAAPPPPARPLDPPTDISNFFWLTKPDGSMALMPFYDHDDAGYIKVDITTSHTIPGVHVVNLNKFPGLCNPDDTSKPYRVLLVGSHRMIKAFSERRDKAELKIVKTIGRNLFPGARMKAFRLMAGSQNFKMDWISSETRKESHEGRLIFDYRVPDYEMEPQVIIVNLKLTRPTLEITILHDAVIEAAVNGTIERLIEKEREELEALQRPWANDVEEMNEVFAETMSWANGAFDLEIAVEEKGNTQKRAWTNDEDGIAEEETTQSNKRQKRVHEESLEGEMVGSVEEGTADDKSLKEWMSEPRITLHGMDDFNPEDWG